MRKKEVKSAVKRAISFALSTAMVVTLMPTFEASVQAADDNTPYVISMDRPVYASTEVGNSTADKIVDGDTTTRWESTKADPQWVYVDLGKQANITGFHILWEAAYAKSYKVQVSNDEENWEDIYSVGNPNAGGEEPSNQDINISYNITGDGNVSASWNSIDNANYKIYVDTEGNYAKAPDGYTFSNHPAANGLIKLAEGTYELIVVAVSKTTGAELGRGTKTVYVSAQQPTEEQGPATDPKDVTVETTATARYVRIYMNERATNYAYSIYEFEVLGTNGVARRPDAFGENIAKDKTVTSSSLREVWWMYNNGVLDQTNVLAENAVDGKTNTSWTSGEDDNQWLCVDLGKAYNIGRVIINWTTDAGKIYDIQISNNKSDWTTLYRMKRGYPELVDNVVLAGQSARYVRIYGYARVENGSGFGIKELEVYEYKNGDATKTYTIGEISDYRTVNTTKGSYITEATYLEKAKLPVFIDEDTIQTPIASNDWWQSAMIKKFGNPMLVMPFKAAYSKKGLSLLTSTQGWLPTMKDTDVNVSVVSENMADLYILPENVDTATAYDRVHKYGDYSAELQLCDETGVAMTSTHVKGSPYTFLDFTGKENVYISVPNLTTVYNDAGNAILTNGQSATLDHFGIEITDNDNKEGTYTSKNYYCVTLPAGTTVKIAGGKIKVTFGADKYMSVATMLNKNDLNTYFQHGYAFVTDTQVGYSYSENLSKITSNYTVTTTLKRSGYSNVTMQLMMPHQWKKSSNNAQTAKTYKSVRGDMHGVWSNTFSTVDTFRGLLPQFTMPSNPEFDQDKCFEYLKTLDSATSNLNPAADAYWEGKNLHPLGIGALMADQLGETEMRDEFLARLKHILVNWFTYDGPDDVSYFIYDENWGTLYYAASEFGANTGICDHHFTYGYFMFGATVLATYDKQFYNDYKDMIEMLIRDYANPAQDDSEYCEFRAYDMYESHSWAGGYADNDSGNNQESASESLFSWVGMYLWGVLTENDTYRDAAIFGFTNEMEAVEQYWFDYDKDNWIDEWPYEVVGQVYGGINFYGTFFGGQPLYVYGIQWLPISEYLTYYGMNQARAQEIYEGLESDTERAMNIAEIVARNEGKSEAEIEKLLREYPHPDTGWQHITWPFLSQYNADLALQKFNANVDKVQRTDGANTYWFINAMKQFGHKATDLYATGDVSAAVYYNETTHKYTANVWNPRETAQTVSIKNAAGNTLGTAVVGSKAFVKFEVDTNNQFAYTQVATPTFKSKALSNGAIKNNIYGVQTYDDTQIVTIDCADAGTTIHYTLDGSIPTVDSPVYNGEILVSSNATIKAIATKNGYIDSTFASVSMVINGDAVASEDNLALGKNAVASTEAGQNKAGQATDGSKGSRWESATSDDQWIYVDLGAEYAVNSVNLNWEAAYASQYEIYVSKDANEWTKVATVNNNKAGDKATEFAATDARYVKMQGIKRATDYGYSIFEFEVYGAVKAAAPTITPASGTYNGAQTVTLSTSVKGAEVKYTIDGTIPTEDSPSYTAPFTVDKSTVVKAVTYRKGMTLSDVTTSSIVINGTVGLSATEMVVAVGNSKTLTALTNGTVTWTSSNPSVAKVVNGVVTGVSEGTAVITAKVGSNTATCTVTVAKAVPLTQIVLSNTELDMTVKTETNLTVSFVPANTTDDTTVTWTSSNPSVATVADGKISAKTEGTTVITATCGNKTATCTVTVNPKYTVAQKLVNPEYNVFLNGGATLFQSGKFEGQLSALVDKIGFNGQAGGNWASQVVEAGAADAFIIADLADSYALNQIDAMYIEWKNNDGTLPVDGFKIMVADDAAYNVTKDGEDVVEDNSTWTTVFDSSKNNATNATGGYDWATDEVGCLSILPLANSSYKKMFNHVKIAFNYKSNRRPWGVQAYEIALLKNDNDPDVNAGGENPTVNPGDETTKPGQEETTDNGVEKPVVPFGIDCQDAGNNSFTIVMGNPLNGQTYNVYVDGTFVQNISLGAHTITGIAAGAHTIGLTGVLNGYESTAATVNVTVTGAEEISTEAPTEADNKIEGGIEINGFQISTTAGGNRTVYSVEPEIDGKAVVEKGLIFGLGSDGTNGIAGGIAAGFATEADMVVGSTSQFVKNFKATETNGKLSSNFSESDTASSYAMTMIQKFDTMKTTGFTATYLVRAYAKLSDGSYVYTDVYSYSLYSIADRLYQDKSMPTQAGHEYLYNKILKKVNASYGVIGY
jgi:endoglucanase Acf2